MKDVSRIIYDAYDKVAEVRTLVGDTLIVQFAHDGGGHRTQKVTYTQAGAVAKVTYYFRDAEGNTMGVYEQPGGTGALTLKEHTLYSSGRLGLFYRQEDRYTYELTDHLGNVRATVERRLIYDTDPTPADPYPVLAYMADYYPFACVPLLNNARRFTVRYSGAVGVACR